MPVRKNVRIPTTDPRVPGGVLTLDSVDIPEDVIGPDKKVLKPEFFDKLVNDELDRRAKQEIRDLVPDPNAPSTPPAVPDTAVPTPVTDYVAERPLHPAERTIRESRAVSRRDPTGQGLVQDRGKMTANFMPQPMPVELANDPNDPYAQMLKTVPLPNERKVGTQLKEGFKDLDVRQLPAGIKSMVSNVLTRHTGPLKAEEVASTPLMSTLIHAYLDPVSAIARTAPTAGASAILGSAISPKVRGGVAGATKAAAAVTPSEGLIANTLKTGITAAAGMSMQGHHYPFYLYPAISRGVDVFTKAAKTPFAAAYGAYQGQKGLPFLNPGITAPFDKFSQKLDQLSQPAPAPRPRPPVSPMAQHPPVVPSSGATAPVTPTPFTPPQPPGPFGSLSNLPVPEPQNMFGVPVPPQAPPITGIPPLSTRTVTPKPKTEPKPVAPPKTDKTPKAPGKEEAAAAAVTETEPPKPGEKTGVPPKTEPPKEAPKEAPKPKKTEPAAYDQAKFNEHIKNKFNFTEESIQEKLGFTREQAQAALADAVKEGRISKEGTTYSRKKENAPNTEPTKGKETERVEAEAKKASEAMLKRMDSSWSPGNPISREVVKTLSELQGVKMSEMIQQLKEGGYTIAAPKVVPGKKK